MGMMGGGGGPQVFDAKGAFSNETDMLNITKHEFISDKYEREILGDRYPTPNTGLEIDLTQFNNKSLLT